jgi:hypothetical protein
MLRNKQCHGDTHIVNLDAGDHTADMKMVLLRYSNAGHVEGLLIPELFIN